MKLLLVNPNLTPAVTAAVLRAAEGAARPGTTLHAVTGDFGPLVIGSRAENALAQHGVLDLVARHAGDCDAVVLAVSLDTALWACRELLDIPVLGMTEAGLIVASTLATKIGVLTYGARMGPFYRELAEAHGFGGRLAEVVTIDVTPQQTFIDPAAVEAAVLAGARRLVEAHGAEAVLLAGAAMAGLAPRLQPQLPVPLIDGVTCAVALAESLALLRLPKARTGSVAPTGGREVRGVSPALAALFARGIAP